MGKGKGRGEGEEREGGKEGKREKGGERECIHPTLSVANVWCWLDKSLFLTRGIAINASVARTHLPV